MIHLSFRLSNPFSNRFEHAVIKNGMITQNKSWECNIYRTSTVCSGSVELTMRKDHAGLRLQVGLLGYEVEFHIYDVRHWDNVQEEYS